MGHTSKKIRRVVRVLTDPRPTFVSLVAHGANQQPFRVVKLAKQNDGDDTMTTAQKAAASAVIQSIQFSADQFSTEDDVQTYLKENGYEDVDVVKSENGFGVVLEDASDFGDDSIQDINADNGVVFKVARLSEDGSGTEPENTSSAKDADDIKSVKDSDTDTDDDQPADQTDPEDAEPLTDESFAQKFAALLELAQTTQKADQELARRGFWDVCNLAEILQALRWMVVDSSYGEGLPDDVVSRLKTHSLGLVEALSLMVDDCADKLSGTFSDSSQKDAEPEGDPEDAPSQKSSQVDKDKSSPEDWQEAVRGMIGEVVGDALKPLKKGVSESVDAIKSIKETVSGVESRVADMETLTAGRKSVDDVSSSMGDGSEDTEEIRKNAEFERRQSSNLFGI